MGIEVAIDGEDILINGRPTYAGRVDERGRRIEGLLFNSRMVQAIFDDAEPATRPQWAYPDTGVWDPERNVAEFCAALPTYRAHGLLAVTIGLQGGGPAYRPEIYERYRNTAFRDDGSLDPAYVSRLRRVLAALDGLGMVAIVNYFYLKQVKALVKNNTLVTAIERATEFLLSTGHRNIMVDLANEAHRQFPSPQLQPETIHLMLDVARNVTLDGRRLLIGASTVGGADAQPTEAWLASSDIALPHTNGLEPAVAGRKLLELRHRADFRARPMPVIVNEDGPDVANLEPAVDHHCSWGYYDQGAGSGYSQPGAELWQRPREKVFAEMSGFQSPPVNWTINTPQKRAFFERVRALTGAC